MGAKCPIRVATAAVLLNATHGYPESYCSGAGTVVEGKYEGCFTLCRVARERDKPERVVSGTWYMSQGVTLKQNFLVEAGLGKCTVLQTTTLE